MPDNGIHKKRELCRNCGRSGHISENCSYWSKPTNPKFRGINESITSEPPTDIVNLTAEDCPVIEEIQSKQNKSYAQAVYTIQQQQKPKNYPKSINSWAQYLNNHGAKPKTQQKL